MRIHNVEVFQQGLRNYAHRVAPGFSQYSKWLSESTSKWLTKNSSPFKEKFLVPIQEKSITIMSGLPKVYQAKVNGVDTRLYFEDPFDQKDVAAGTLFYYTGTDTALSHWLLQEHKIVVDARDFFYGKVTENLDFDLRVHTPVSLVKTVRDWHIERERLLAEQARRELAEAKLSPAVKSEFQTMLSVSRAVLGVPDERDRLLDSAWALLQEGRDYTVMGLVSGHELLQYKSSSALEWESAFKLNCLNSSMYKNRLTDSDSMILSLRVAGQRNKSLYTIECSKAREWEILQFERWGYAHPNSGSDDLVEASPFLRRDVKVLVNAAKDNKGRQVYEFSLGAK